MAKAKHQSDKPRQLPAEVRPGEDRPAASKAPVDITEESVAGEEDPGAAMEQIVGVPPQASPSPGNKKEPQSRPG